MKNESLLLIFTKNPDRGKVKTRLAKDIGEENALKIYNILLKHSHQITSGLKHTKYVYYSENIPEKDLWNSGSFIKKLQQGDDLGEKMENAFKEGFSEGYRKIVIIGSDLYELELRDIQDSFNALDGNDYVIGPAKDGGYYLLGMKSFNSDIFRNKNWSTSSVFSETLRDFKGGKIKILRTQNDIDVLDDIKDHQAFQKFLKL